MRKVITTLAVSLALPLAASAVFLAAPAVALAAYDDVQLYTGSTLQMNVNGSLLDFTVASGSVVDLTANASSLVFNLVAGSIVDITSTSRTTYTLSKATGVSSGLNCTDSNSVLTLSGSGSTNLSVTATPTGTACVLAGTTGGGGGGGGNGGGSSGGGAAPATPAAPAAPATPAVPASTTTPATPAVPATSAVPATPSPAAQPSPVALAVSPAFNKDLAVGSRSDDVKHLQQLLATDKDIYPSGLATGYFGNLTKAAVVKFQLKYGVIKSAKDAGAGRLGPKTRAKIKDVFGRGQPSVPVSTPAASTPAANPPASPTVQSQQEQLKTLKQQLLDLQAKLKAK